MAMTTEERQAAFNKLFEALPEKKNVDRLKRVAGLLFCQVNTVRIWRMANPPRVIPEQKLRMLQKSLGA